MISRLRKTTTGSSQTHDPRCHVASDSNEPDHVRSVFLMPWRLDKTSKTSTPKSDKTISSPHTLSDDWACHPEKKRMTTHAEVRHRHRSSSMSCTSSSASKVSSRAHSLLCILGPRARNRNRKTKGTSSKRSIYQVGPMVLPGSRPVTPGTRFPLCTRMVKNSGESGNETH